MGKTLMSRLAVKNVRDARRWLKYLGIALLGLVALMVIAVLFAPKLGWRIDAVQSGSMSPDLEVGTAVITRDVDPDTIKLDDVITYHSPRNGRLTTHRVVGIKRNSPLLFQTKGDANENPDAHLVPAANVEGKVVFDVPLVGHAADFIRTPLGFGLVLGLPGIIIISVEMRRMWVEMSEEEKRKKTKVSGDVDAAK